MVLLVRGNAFVLVGPTTSPFYNRFFRSSKPSDKAFKNEIPVFLSTLSRGTKELSSGISYPEIPTQLTIAMLISASIGKRLFHRPIVR